MSYAMVRVTGLSLDEFAAAAGLHPDLVRRLVALGLVTRLDDPTHRQKAIYLCVPCFDRWIEDPVGS